MLERSYKVRTTSRHLETERGTLLDQILRVKQTQIWRDLLYVVRQGETAGNLCRIALHGRALAVSVLLVACGDGLPTAPEVERNPDIRAYVVLEAAEAVGTDGRFRIPADVRANPEATQLVSAARASELGTAFVKSFGPSFLRFWQQDRGASVNLAALKVDARAYPIQSSFGAVPMLGCHPAFVRLFGSFYRLTFNDGAEPELLMAVSAQTVEYGVDTNGNLEHPPLTGEDFLTEGIPINGRPFSPVTPEQAVAIAARATGAKIRDVPALAARNEHSHTEALWRLVLDREVLVAREDDSKARTVVLYISPLPDTRFFVAADVQPTTVTVSCLKIDENFETVGFIPLTVSVNQGAIIEFTPMTIVRP